jgi:hypothetical protein
MVVGPIARILAQIVVPLVAVLARAIPAAYQQALQNARKGGVDAQAATNVFRKTLSKSEALNILNLTEKEASTEMIQKVRRTVARKPRFTRTICCLTTYN